MEKYPLAPLLKVREYREDAAKNGSRIFSWLSGKHTAIKKLYSSSPVWFGF